MNQLTIKVETYGIKVYEHLARIMLGRADWGTLVAHLNAAVEKFIQEKVYAEFAAIVKVVSQLLSKYQVLLKQIF